MAPKLVVEGRGGQPGPPHLQGEIPPQIREKGPTLITLLISGTRGSRREEPQERSRSKGQARLRRRTLTQVLPLMLLLGCLLSQVSSMQFITS